MEWAGISSRATWFIVTTMPLFKGLKEHFVYSVSHDLKAVTTMPLFKGLKEGSDF
jgi:hypothetical protein